MKRFLIFIIIASSIGFAETNYNITGGVTLSKVDGNVMGSDPDNILGMKIGVEQIQSNGFITGLTYTQRGFEISESYYGYSASISFKLNYLTIYGLQEVYSSPQFDLVAGGELGMFFSGETKYCAGDYGCNSEKFNMQEWSDDMEGNTFDYGVLLGGRYKINEQFTLNANYYMAFSDWANELEVQNRSLQFTVTYNASGNPSTKSSGSSGFNLNPATNSSGSSPSSNSSKSASSSKGGGHCVAPSKVYGSADIDNFLQTSFEICESLEEAKELLSEVNKFVDNPKLYVTTKVSSEIADMKSEISGELEDIRNEVEEKTDIEGAIAREMSNFKNEVNGMIANLPMMILNKTIDTLKESGNATKSAKGIKGMDKLKAVKDVSNAVKNLKKISETAPEVIDEFNSLLSKL